jgi:tyrosyl-tRNA synthetase
MIISDYHDSAAATVAREEFERVFRNKKLPEDMETREIAASAEITRLPKVLASLGLAPSVSEASRLIQSGAVTVNGDKITSPRSEIDVSSRANYIFKVGKRRFMRLLVR